MSKLILIYLLFLTSVAFGQTGNKPDSELSETWAKFKLAVKTNDKNSLKAISSDTIICVSCWDDTEAERQSNLKLRTEKPQWYDTFFKPLLYVPFDKFYTDDYPVIFNENLLSRLDDSTKLYFSKLNEYNSSYHFSITTEESNHLFEGFHTVFEFKKTNTGYKFFGVSGQP